MEARRSAGFGLGLAVLSALTFATSGTFARSLIAAGWSAEAAVAARVGIAALVLAVPAAIALRGRWRVLRRNARTLGLFGLLAVGGAQVGFFNAVRYLPVGVALLLEYLGVILVVVWMWAVHGQRPRSSDGRRRRRRDGRPGPRARPDRRRPARPGRRAVGAGRRGRAGDLLRAVRACRRRAAGRRHGQRRHGDRLGHPAAARRRRPAAAARHVRRRAVRRVHDELAGAARSAVASSRPSSRTSAASARPASWAPGCPRSSG